MRASGIKKFGNISIGDLPPTFTPINYPLDANIMTTEYFTALDINETTISPEYDIEMTQAYLTDYISDASRDYDHFLTVNEIWGMPRDNSVIFKLTQPEEVSEVSMTFANTFANPSTVNVLYLDNGSWINVGSNNDPSNTNVTITTTAHTGQTYKIEMIGGDSNYYIDPGFTVKLR